MAKLPIMIKDSAFDTLIADLRSYTAMRRKGGVEKESVEVREQVLLLLYEYLGDHDGELVARTLLFFRHPVYFLHEGKRLLEDLKTLLEE